LKYVNKTILGEDKTYAALLFASNKRMFSMSQNLMAMLNIRRNSTEQGWTFEGTVDENTLEAFCREQNVSFGDIVKIEATTEMYYNYPMLFEAWDAG